MSSENDLTPEEKLLALIRQDKRQGSTSAASTPTRSPVPAPMAEPALAAGHALASLDPDAHRRAGFTPAMAGISPALPGDSELYAKSDRLPVPPPILHPLVVPESPPMATVPVPAPVPEPAPPLDEPPEVVVAAVQTERIGAVLPASAPVTAEAPTLQPVSVSVPPVAASDGVKPSAAEAGRKLKLAAPASAPISVPAGAPSPVPLRPAPLAVPVIASPAAASTPVAQPPAATPRPLTPPAPAPVASKPIRATGVRVFGWPLVNRALALVVLVLMVAVVYSIASIQSGIEVAMASQINEAGELAVVPVGDEPAKPPELEGILQKVSVRGIFEPLEGTGPKPPGSKEAPPAEFKLVGVSIDIRTPEATMAIIRDKASQQKFFVKIGDSLGDTGYTLGRVLADHVILKKQKQEIEVR